MRHSYDLRIPDCLQRPEAVRPYYALVLQAIGPERALHLFATALEPKPDKVVGILSDIPSMSRKIGTAANVSEGAPTTWIWFFLIARALSL